MRRVIIIGCGGAGKSTLAVRLGDVTGLPVVHMDRLFWQPGWVEPEREDFLQRLLAALPPDGAWICDGNYSNTMDQRIALADTIVFIDRSSAVCVGRVIRRSLKKQQPHDRTQGCPPRLTPEFLRYVANYNRTRRLGILDRLRRAHAAGKVVHRLRSESEIERFLRDLVPQECAHEFRSGTVDRARVLQRELPEQ